MPDLREGTYAVGFGPSTHAVTGDQGARDDADDVAGGRESRTYSTTFRIIDATAQPGAAGL